MKSSLERGQGVTEYALLIAFIAAVIVGGIFFTGQRMASYFDRGSTAVSAPISAAHSHSGSASYADMSLGPDSTPTPSLYYDGSPLDASPTPTPAS